MRVDVWSIGVRIHLEAGGDGRGWRQEGGVKANMQCRRLGNTRLILLPLFCAIIERKRKKTTTANLFLCLQPCKHEKCWWCFNLFGSRRGHCGLLLARNQCPLWHHRGLSMVPHVLVHTSKKSKCTWRSHDYFLRSNYLVAKSYITLIILLLVNVRLKLSKIQMLTWIYCRRPRHKQAKTLPLTFTPPKNTHYFTRWSPHATLEHEWSEDFGFRRYKYYCRPRQSNATSIGFQDEERGTWKRLSQPGGQEVTVWKKKLYIHIFIAPLWMKGWNDRQSERQEEIEGEEAGDGETSVSCQRQVAGW